MNLLFVSAQSIDYLYSCFEWTKLSLSHQCVDPDRAIHGLCISMLLPDNQWIVCSKCRSKICVGNPWTIQINSLLITYIPYTACTAIQNFPFNSSVGARFAHQLYQIELCAATLSFPLNSSVRGCFAHQFYQIVLCATI